MTEFGVEFEGVLWLGEDECRVVLIPGTRSGVLSMETLWKIGLEVENVNGWIRE